MNDMPSVLISVLNWNNASDTIKCIHSLNKLNYSNFVIVIVDNASGDRSDEKIASSFPTIKIIKSKRNLGYAGGNALAAEYAIKQKYDAVWVLNNDAEVDADALDSFVRAWQENGDCIFGSIIVNKDTKVVEFSGGYELDHTGYLDPNSRYNELPKLPVDSYIEMHGHSRAVADVNGASIFIPMNIIMQAGFMLSRFFLYAEELEYCFRLKNEFGIDCYIVNNSIIYHEGSASFEIHKGLKPIQQYYNKRNFTWLQLHYFEVCKSDIINKMGGRKAFYRRLIKCVFKSYFFMNPYPDTEMIAVFHAFIGRLGRVYNPSRFIS